MRHLLSTLTRDLMLPLALRIKLYGQKPSKIEKGQHVPSLCLQQILMVYQQFSLP